MTQKSYYILFTILLYFPLQVFGFKLTPMSASIASSGKEARTSFQIENDGEKAVPIQVIVTKRVMDEEGKEKYPPAGDDFLVYPSQVILAPKEKRTINIRYIAGRKGGHQVEEAFRVIAEQLPLPMDEKKEKEKSGINVLLRYIAALYVLPIEEKLDLKVEEIKIKNPTTLEVKLTNTGTVHQILDQYALKMSWLEGKKKKEFTLKGTKELQGLFGENILASHTRIFTLKHNQKIQGDSLKAELIAHSQKE